MTDGVETFEALQTALVFQASNLGMSLQGEQNRLAGMLNDAANSPIAIAESMLPGGDQIAQAITKWNDEIQPATDKAWGTLTEDLWDAVGELAGKPLALLDYARSFSSVKATIYNQEDLAQMLAIFDHDWQGYAATSYKVVAQQQEAAVLALSMACDNGALLITNVAKQILHLWRRLANEFLSWGADLIDIFATATDLGSILTFEVPAILKAVKTIIQNIIDLADILADYLVNQLTDSINWTQLVAGARGLPQNQWPTVNEANSDTMNDPGEWTPQTA